MLRYRAIIEYDGAAYFGFQRQIKGQPTVQSELEDVLYQITQQPVTVLGAGRTDRGVHALGQAVSFKMQWRHGVNALKRALNAGLPMDIVIRELDVVPLDFHPRFDAKRRAYRYHIHNSECRRPVYRHWRWHVRPHLDVSVMALAAACLVGEHDFATFGRPPQGINTIREVFEIACERHEELVTVFIEGNAFLQRMVRSIVGSLKLVGEGRWSVDEFVDAFTACDRSRCGMIAPPHGLYLVYVTYEV